MEHDTETILKAFNQHLLNDEKPLLTESQRAVLAWCLSHPNGSYQDIAAASGYSANSLRDAGSKLFTAIESVLGKRVRKSTCGRVVREWYRQKALVDNTNLLGREADLQTLLNAITVEGRRLVCISGPPRIGKTYLVRHLKQQLLDLKAFDTSVEGRCTQLPTVEDLNQYILTSLQNGYPTQAYPPQLSSVAALTHLLDTRKLLLILEKTEVLQEPDALGGAFKSTSTCYEEWLRALLDRHSLSSCVILVCRVPPRCLQTSHDVMCHHPLQSLTADAAGHLLRQQGLNAYSTEQLEQLGRFCGYSPGVLAALARKVLHSGNRDLRHIIRNPLAVPHADDSLWQAAMDDLTQGERELVGWLMLHPDVRVTWDGDGLRLNGQPVPALELALQALRNRGLIEVDPTGAHVIQTEWLRHVMRQNLLKELAQTLLEQNPQALNRYPLVEPQAPQERRQEHWQSLLGKLSDQLTHLNPEAWTTQFRTEAINAMLNQLRTHQDWQEGYGAGNLLNIAAALKVPLSDLNLAGLTIQNADLRAIPWKGVNLTGCHLINTVLPMALHGTLAAALSPDGGVIAVGDESGRILCWQRLHDRFEVFRFAQIPAVDGSPTGITLLAFGAEDMLAIGAGQEVYRWWLGTPDSKPARLMVVPFPITSLACGGDEYVAAGLQNGSIRVWYEPSETTVEFKGHSGAVRELATAPERYSGQLASRGFGDRILLWQVGAAGPPEAEIRPERYIFFALAWQSGRLMAAAYVDDQFLLWMADGTTHPLPFQGNVGMLRFSPSGDAVVALKGDVVDVQTLPDRRQVASIPRRGQIKHLAICNQGTWVLMVEQDQGNSPATIRVWDTTTKQFCWELAARPSREPSQAAEAEIMLQQCQGLSDVERAYWQSYGVIV